MTTQHSEYGGSNYRWLYCAGATQLLRKVPRRPAGPAAEHGTAQHEVMEALLLDEKKEPKDFLGVRMSNGIVIDDQHMGALETALDAYMEISDAFPGATFISAEKRVTLTEEAFGTADVLMVDGERGAVIDFKFGQVEVDPASEQGRIYAVYARKSVPAFAAVTEFHNYIIQPAFDPAIAKKAYPVSVIEKMEDQIFAAIRASKQPNPPYVEGEWCKWCDAKLACPAKLGALSTLTKPNHILDLNDLGAQVLKIRQWIKWAEEGEERIHHELSNGVPVNGWKLVNKRAVRVWKSEPEAILNLKRLNVPPEKYLITSLLTPNKAEEFMKKKTVDELTNKVSSGTTIAPMDDKRPAVLPMAAVAAQLKRAGK